MLSAGCLSAHAAVLLPERVPQIRRLGSLLVLLAHLPVIPFGEKGRLGLSKVSPGREVEPYIFTILDVFRSLQRKTLSLASMAACCINMSFAEKGQASREYKESVEYYPLTLG